MNKKTVYLWLKDPYQPLFSDKCLIWLASTYAAAGYRIIPVCKTVVPEKGEILLTNMKSAETAHSSGGDIFRLTSPTDRVNRLMRLGGYYYGKSRFFHATAPEGANPFVQRLLRALKASFRSDYKHAYPAEKVSGDEACLEIPSGRRVVFRVNVDWDDKGFDVLERWCETYGLRPTLAVAGSEIEGRQTRLKSLVERFDLDAASHSLSHYVVLSSRSRASQQREIHGSRRMLEDLLGKKITGFVAPYGKYDRRTFELLEEAGYRWFIRSWAVAPLPLACFRLYDLGVSFFFRHGWRGSLEHRLALSDLVLQLHLRDLPGLSDGIEWLFEKLAKHGVRVVDCETYYKETCSSEGIK